MTGFHVKSEAIAWAGGLYEGEGTATLCNGIPRLSIRMTDEDIVRRFSEIIGVGKVYGPYRNTEKDGYARKPYWVWLADGETAAREAFDLLHPWLGSRRIQQGEAILRPLPLRLEGVAA